jgi:hypothetical protein
MPSARLMWLVVSLLIMVASGGAAGCGVGGNISPLLTFNQ